MKENLDRVIVVRQYIAVILVAVYANILQWSEHLHHREVSPRTKHRVRVTNKERLFYHSLSIPLPICHIQLAVSNACYDK